MPEYAHRVRSDLWRVLFLLKHGGVYADADIERGMQVLDRRLESFSKSYGLRYDGHYYFYYGHYYAVQAYHIVGGKRYRDYFRMIEDVLLRMQREDGSWPNRIGPGTVYGTATACLILQIPKEYLPIFQR